MSDVPKLPPLNIIDKMDIDNFMYAKDLENLHSVNRQRMKLWVKVFYKSGQNDLNSMSDCIKSADRAVDGFDSLFGTGDKPGEK